MSSSPQLTVTRLLEAVQNGDQEAVNALFGLVYDELHLRAQQQRHRWNGNHTINTTALLHEAYLKLVDQQAVHWKSRDHFYAVAATAMRHVLINYAKHRSRKKRGGDVHKVSLEALPRPLAGRLTLSDDQAETLVLLDEALGRLQAQHERQSRVVECRFFGQMTIEETARALDVSPATVKRDWQLAQAWLYKEMQRALEP